MRPELLRLVHSAPPVLGVNGPRDRDCLQFGPNARRHEGLHRTPVQNDGAAKHDPFLGRTVCVCLYVQPLSQAVLVSEEEVIQSRTFSHRQEYKFKFHRLKANILCKRQFPQIRRYLWHIAENCPNELFQEGGARCSDGNLPELGLQLVRKDTNAVPLARLGLVLAKHRRGRHEAIQRFMLANDSAPIAVGVPVYRYPNEAPDLKLADVLTGHIDVLQIRYGKVWILDYKPEAKRETRAKFQLYLYAKALSTRTRISALSIRSRLFSTTRITSRWKLSVSVPGARQLDSSL